MSNPLDSNRDIASRWFEALATGDAETARGLMHDDPAATYWDWDAIGCSS